ncbi:UMTA protein [Colletotrichum tabaci]|uniref:UMTA protein n=1 Tax=Colletotrichum tabaci TaxID=1209068 RepID=A0AAV9T1R3_9PEZI
MVVTKEAAVSPNPLPASDQENITADPIVEDDNATEADLASIRTYSSVSLSESITEYRRIHGRTYTQKTDYWGPNDERQNQGLDLAHYWETLLLGDKLFLAPIGDSPKEVLDVGTGTGIWAIDFADGFPSAEVTGVDISPIQPGWVPPNCKFHIDDIEKPWTWPAEHFDFVHVKHLEGSVADWPRLYGRAFTHLKPGGYIELREVDIEGRSQTLGELDDGHIYKRWAKVMLEAMGRLGKTGTQARDHGIARNLASAGFVDVVEKKWSAPIGRWPRDPVLKEIGACHLQFLDESLEGFGTFLLKEVMRWGDPEILAFMGEMRKALKDPRLQSYLTLHLVYARKPERSEETQEKAVTAAVA